MVNRLVETAFALVRFSRRLRKRAKLISLRLRGVIVDSSAVVDPRAVIEPSGGKISIGARTFIDQGVVIRPLGGYVEIGEDCSVHAYSVMYGGGGLTIGNFVRIAAHTVMVPSNHEYSDTAIPITKQGLSMKGIVVEDDVWVGAGARILDGVRLRTGTVVGAGAVLTHSTNEFSVVAGVPARQLATRTKFAPSKS